MFKGIETGNQEKKRVKIGMKNREIHPNICHP